MTIPTMLGFTAAAFAAAPFIIPATVVADLVRLRLRLPTVRVYLFLLQYAFNDSAEIVLSPFYWLIAGFGRRLDSASSIERHQRLQFWSLRLLAKRAEQLLGLRIELDEQDRSELTPGPVIVISRHASLFDASLPGLIYQHEGLTVRGVIMAELLADPGFDLIYGRLGSVFIPRDRGAAAVAEIERMADSASDDTAFVIFPEGRLFRPEVKERMLKSVNRSDPDRAEKMAELTHVLPPRAGGLQALLATVPTADVVLVDHTGLDRYQGLSHLLDSVPAKDPVEISVRRIPRAEIPDDPDEQVIWLDDLWLGIDASLVARRT